MENKKLIRTILKYHNEKQVQLNGHTKWIKYHEDRPSGSISVRFYDASRLSGLSRVFTLKLEELCQDEYVFGCKEDRIFGAKLVVVFVHHDLCIFERVDNVQRS